MRVLIVASRFPLPPWRGNQVRTVEWLRALAGEEIALVCPRPAQPELARQIGHEKAALWSYASGLGERAGAVVASLVDGQPIQEGLYAARSAHRALSRAVREQRPEVAIVQMVRCGWALEQLRREVSGLPVLFDAIDAMGLHFERAALLAPPALRPLLRAEAGRCRRRERELASRAALSIHVPLLSSSIAPMLVSRSGPPRKRMRSMLIAVEQIDSAAATPPSAARHSSGGAMTRKKAITISRSLSGVISPRSSIA